MGNYNYESYVGQAIESVLNQTNGKFELIVCDDGSTDGSCDVIERYARADPRVRFLRKATGGRLPPGMRLTHRAAARSFARWIPTTFSTRTS